jgi:NADH dehydrogenase
MSPRSDLVTIFGGAGFVGRYLARHMAQAGWRVRVATRRPEEALFVRGYGHVGQVQPVFCNIRDQASVRAALLGAQAAVNCVGTFDAAGRNSFAAIHVEGAERVARLAAAAGAGRLVHLSALGASPEAQSAYGRSKAEGEERVRAAFAGAVILRPSVVFGPEDQFFNRFAAMALCGPVVPVVGAATRFQPVYVDDLARAAALAAQGLVPPGVYELGGPETLSFRELMRRMLGHIRRRRAVMGIPFWAAEILAAASGAGRALSLGLLPQPITRDQVASLRSDNVVSGAHPGFEAFGIVPAALDAVLPDYLWRFRPSGQYEAIKESARNLRS